MVWQEKVCNIIIFYWVCNENLFRQRMQYFLLKEGMQCILLKTGMQYNNLLLGMQRKFVSSKYAIFFIKRGYAMYFIKNGYAIKNYLVSLKSMQHLFFDKVCNKILLCRKYAMFLRINSTHTYYVILSQLDSSYIYFLYI
jgi:hypothetical protein